MGGVVSDVERVHVPGSAAFVAVIADGAEIKSKHDAASWRYHNKRVVLVLVMPDGGLVEQSYAVDMDVAFTASSESFECRIGRGMHRYEGCQLVVARPSAL